MGTKRTRITKDIIIATENMHSKHPEMNNEQIAYKIGISGTSVGRILAGCYDIIDGKARKKKNPGNTAPVATVRNVTEEKPKDELASLADLAKLFAPKAEEEPVKKPEFSLDFSDPTLSGIISMVMPLITSLFKDDKKKEEQPKEEQQPKETTTIDKQRFRKKVMTEIQTLREIQVDMYKELRQIKGILAELRDVWKK